MKKITVACTACQRRKVKCVGNPCAYCLKKNYICEFKEATKRGPKSIKFPTNLKDDVLNYVQESMGMMCLQQNFVDFYFHFIGISIPNAYKSILLSSVNKSIRAQVYIITASIMKLYGDKDQEMLYISKAHRASSLFESDTVESGISLMMMANYLGNETPKGKNQLRLALSTFKLPTIESSKITVQAIMACESTLLIYDSSISKQQRSHFILSGLQAVDLKELAANHPSSEVVTVGTAVIANLIYTLCNLDDSNATTLLSSISSIMLTKDRTTILEYINKFSIVLQDLQNLPSSVESYARFAINYSQFIVEWKSGNHDVAFEIAKKTIEILKSNARAIAIKVGGVIRLLLLPYYFQGCGALEIVGPLLQLIEDACASDTEKEQKRRLWEELCGNLQSYNIGVLEKELFGELAYPSAPLSASIAPFSPTMFIEELGGYNV